MDETRTLLTTLEAARILKLSNTRVLQLERVGRLTAQRTSTGQRIFDRADVLRLARERAQK